MDAYVCGAVVEEASREGGGQGFESWRSHSVETLREKCATCDFVDDDE
jgi:hypothetical protein